MLLQSVFVWVWARTMEHGDPASTRQTRYQPIQPKWYLVIVDITSPVVVFIDGGAV